MLRKIRFQVFYYICFIILANGIHAQNPQWLNYTNGDNIKALAEENNNIWVGTLGGLVKIDKITGTPTFYNPSNSGLPNISVSSIVIDGNGTKWIGTLGGGLVKFDETNWIVFNTTNSGMPHDYVQSITIDEDGTKWIATAVAGLVKFDGSDWTPLKHRFSALDEICAFC